MVKVITNDKHMAIEILDVTYEKAIELTKTGKYKYLNITNITNITDKTNKTKRINIINKIKNNKNG